MAVEHKVKLGFDEVRNELQAIAKTGSSAKADDLNFTLQKETLKKFQEEIVALRNGDVNGNFAPREISYNECSQAYFGVSFETVNRALGIKSKSQSFRQAGEMFGLSIGSFSDLLKITTKYSENSIFSSAAPMGTTAIDPTLTWIIPETIMQYIRLGIDSVSKSKDWIAATMPVRTPISTQPYIKPADSTPKIIKEGERIPLGSIEFGQRNVTVYKIGTGIKMTSELQADSTIDIVSLFFKEVGNDIARNIDRSAYLTIVNGDQADGSGAAPVIGVATSGTLLTTDIDTIMTRMSLAYQKPNVLLMGETMYNLDLNASIPTRELLKIAKYAEGAKSDLLPYVPANQITMLYREKCLIELNYRGMVMESEYDASTQTYRYYASRYVGHQKMKDDSAVVLDKSLAISSNNFLQVWITQNYTTVSLLNSMAKFKLREGLNSFTDPSQSNPDNQCISGTQAKELDLTPAVKRAIQNKVLLEVTETPKVEVETQKADKKIMLDITDTIFDNNPFLDRNNPNTVLAVDKKGRNLVLTAKLPQKSNTDVLDETTYTNQQKLLVAYYTAYRLVEKKALENIGGVNGETPTGNVFVTKEKADVVEVEYDIAKSSDGGLLNLNTSEILSGLKLQLCTLAREMNLSLLICKEFCVKAQPVPVMFFPD